MRGGASGTEPVRDGSGSGGIAAAPASPDHPYGILRTLCGSPPDQRGKADCPHATGGFCGFAGLSLLLRLYARRLGQSRAGGEFAGRPVSFKKRGSGFHQPVKIPKGARTISRFYLCEDGFGIGTESVRVIAERYSGDPRFEWKDGMFYVSVMLSAQNKPEKFR